MTARTWKGMEIGTSFVFPPIPTRAFDWQAFVVDMEDESPVGYGATEAEALEELNQILEDDY